MTPAKQMFGYRFDMNRYYLLEPATGAYENVRYRAKRLDVDNPFTLIGMAHVQVFPVRYEDRVEPQVFAQVFRDAYNFRSAVSRELNKLTAVKGLDTESVRKIRKYLHIIQGAQGLLVNLNGTDEQKEERISTFRMLTQMIHGVPSAPRKIVYPRTLEDVFNPTRYVTTGPLAFLKTMNKRFDLGMMDEEMKEIAQTIERNFPEKRNDQYTFEIVDDKTKFLNGMFKGPNTCMSKYANPSRDYAQYWEEGGVLQMYLDNLDKIKLIKIFDPEGNYVGRSLLWTTDQGQQVVDRIYPSDNGAHIAATRQWALESGYVHKMKDSANTGELSDGGQDYTVTLKFPDTVNNVPYFDTFRFTKGINDDQTITLHHLPQPNAQWGFFSPSGQIVKLLASKDGRYIYNGDYVAYSINKFRREN